MSRSLGISIRKDIPAKEKSAKPHYVDRELQLTFCITGLPDSNGKVLRHEVGEVMWGCIMIGMRCHTTITELHSVGYGKSLKDVR